MKSAKLVKACMNTFAVLEMSVLHDEPLLMKLCSTQILSMNQSERGVDISAHSASKN